MLQIPRASWAERRDEHLQETDESYWNGSSSGHLLSQAVEVALVLQEPRKVLLVAGFDLIDALLEQKYSRSALDSEFQPWRPHQTRRHLSLTCQNILLFSPVPLSLLILQALVSP